MSTGEAGAATDAARFGAKGVNGTLLVLPDRILIKRRSVLLRLLGHGVLREKEIGLDEIAGIRFKTATGFVNGFIQLTLAGEQARTGGGLEAAQDPNAVMFKLKQQPAFEQAKAIIERRRRER